MTRACLSSVIRSTDDTYSFVSRYSWTKLLCKPGNMNKQMHKVECMFNVRGTNNTNVANREKPKSKLDRSFELP